MSEVYNSYTHGAIPLSFTGRRLMQNLREAITGAIKRGEYSDIRNEVSFARGELAAYMSKLEAGQKSNEELNLEALEKAGDRMAHELCFRYHQEAMEQWWKVRKGRCTFCEGV